VAHGADPVSAEGGKTECCINAAADIAQLLSADRLYGHFKPKEAARELQRSFWSMSKILKRWSSYLALTSTLTI
jgi:hypothetical protein